MPDKGAAVRKGTVKVNSINKRGGLNVARSQFLLDIVPSHRKQQTKDYDTEETK